MKDSFYFSHDYNARNDPKILELRSEFGLEGYGVYWCIIETLAEDENGRAMPTLMGGLSVGFGIPKDRLMVMIDFMLNIGLLYQDEKGYFSKRMDDHKKERKQLSIKGKEGARKRWNNSPPNSPPNAKERKGKERKEVDTNVSTWRDDFDIYLKECKSEYSRLYSDHSFISEQSRLNPNVNIKLSIEKGYTNFWGTELGWKHKKKSKSVSIDWKSTIINSIEMNKVYYTREELANL